MQVSGEAPSGVSLFICGNCNFRDGLFGRYRETLYLCPRKAELIRNDSLIRNSMKELALTIDHRYRERKPFLFTVG